MKQCFHYSLSNAHHILVEFESIESVNAALGHSRFQLCEDARQVIPTHSQFVWFSANNRILKPPKNESVPDVLTINGMNELKDGELMAMLRQADSVDDQIISLYRNTCLNELGTRLRFLAVLQVENTLSSIFPHIRAYPFGSSVNGFGKLGSDLDVVLKYSLRKETEDPEARLIFHCKLAKNRSRTQAQRDLQILSSIMNEMLPGVTNVRDILQARIPIVKYTHELLNLEVDLSMENL